MFPYASSPMLLQLAEMKNREDRSRTADARMARSAPIEHDPPAPRTTQPRPHRRSFLRLVLNERPWYGVPASTTASRSHSWLRRQRPV